MRKTMIAIVAAASCYAVLAAPGPGREYFGRIKDQVQIVTNGYTKAEVDSLISGATGGVSMVAVEAKVEEKLEPYCTISKAEELFGRITEEDPGFTAWLAMNPLAGFATTAWVNGQGFLKSFTELDPIFSAWLASPPYYTKQQVDSKVAEAKTEAYPKASGNELAEAVRVISLHVQGEDARAVVTNYDSQTHMPAYSLQYKVPDGPDAGTWRIVWNELTRWNWLTGEYLPMNFYNKAEVDAKTDNVPWGFWDSQTGRYSPDNTVQMSAERVILCSGASYQRTVTAQGTYFVWTANEPYEVTGIESNGFFRIEDAEGNVTFEIVKGDKVTAAANPDGLRTEIVMGITHLHIHYPIEADVHPTLEICGDLKTHDWIVETESSCIANVNWTGTSGNYYAEVWSKGGNTGLIFVKGTYKKGSDPYVRYSAALSVQQLRVGDIIYNVGTAQISGHTVLTLTPAN